MRIWVKDGKSRVRLWLYFPNWMIFNTLTAHIAAPYLSQGEGEKKVTPDDMIRLFSAMKKSAKLLHGEPLVQVEDADGDRVTVWL